MVSSWDQAIQGKNGRPYTECCGPVPTWFIEGLSKRMKMLVGRYQLAYLCMVHFCPVDGLLRLNLQVSGNLGDQNGRTYTRQQYWRLYIVTADSLFILPLCMYNRRTYIGSISQYTNLIFVQCCSGKKSHCFWLLDKKRHNFTMLDSDPDRGIEMNADPDPHGPIT